MSDSDISDDERERIIRTLEWRISPNIYQSSLKRPIQIDEEVRVPTREEATQYLLLTAIHEAGHVVLLLHHRSRIVGAQITAEDLKTSGQVLAYPDLNRRKSTECTLGGPVAEELYGGNTIDNVRAMWVPGDGSDWDKAIALVGESRTLQMWGRVREKLLGRLPKLEVLAQRLLLEGWVEGSELRKLARTAAKL